MANGGAAPRSDLHRREKANALTRRLAPEICLEEVPSQHTTPTHRTMLKDEESTPTSHAAAVDQASPYHTLYERHGGRGEGALWRGLGFPFLVKVQ